MTSLRSLYTLTLSSTIAGRERPLYWPRAIEAAFCMNLGAPESTWDFTFFSPAMSVGSPTA